MSEAAVISRAAANGNPGLAGAVLIIDDEAEIRESLQTLLELEGFAVETAASGEAGLQRIGEHPFDLIRSTSPCPAATAWRFWPKFALTEPACPSS